MTGGEVETPLLPLWRRFGAECARCRIYGAPGPMCEACERPPAAANSAEQRREDHGEG